MPTSLRAPRVHVAYIFRAGPPLPKPTRRVFRDQHGQWWAHVQSSGCTVRYHGPFLSRVSARQALAGLS